MKFMEDPTEKGNHCPLKERRAAILHLASVIEAGRLTLREASEIARMPYRTLKQWMSPRARPDVSRVKGVMQAVENHSLTRLRVQESHHLYHDKGRGWETRFTIQWSEKEVGRRIKRRLGTHDLLEAIRIRDVIVDEYRKLGFTVSDRRQKKWKEDSDE